MTRDKLQTAEATINIYRKLLPISKRLHKLDENACNRELTMREEKEAERLMIQAEELAQILGFHAYNQSDPRGCSLYLVNDENNTASRYSNGIAIY